MQGQTINTLIRDHSLHRTGCTVPFLCFYSPLKIAVFPLVHMPTACSEPWWPPRAHGHRLTLQKGLQPVSGAAGPGPRGPLNGPVAVAMAGGGWSPGWGPQVCSLMGLVGMPRGPPGARDTATTTDSAKGRALCQAAKPPPLSRPVGTDAGPLWPGWALTTVHMLPRCCCPSASPARSGLSTATVHPLELCVWQ